MASEKRLIHLDVILKGIETFKRCYEENEKELTPCAYGERKDND